MFNKVLIANRGAIACRIIRTLKQLGIESVAVYAEADRDSLHVSQADQAFSLGEGAAKDTYLNQEKLLAIIQQAEVDAVHPGYGFLSENPDFSALLAANNVTFVGPSAEQMLAFGLKHRARELAEQAGVPLVPGTDLLLDVEQALAAADLIGYPVMLKSTAGGGGIGMQVCLSAQELSSAFGKVKHLGEQNFSNDGVFLEKFIARARHIEVQVIGNGAGEVVALGERDCSCQRRNQKVVEETPAPNLPQHVREHMHTTAEQLMSSVNYLTAGTVEYIYDFEQEQFYFLEVNTRLQVEHGVTEEVFNVDLVKWMLATAKQPGLDLNELRVLRPQGHAIQVRVYAEDPVKNFQPSAGLLTQVEFPKTPHGIKGEQAGPLRVDTWVQAGIEVSPFFDPMLAKIIVHQQTREQAISAINSALDNSIVYGIRTNLNYLKNILNWSLFKAGQASTKSLETLAHNENLIEVLSPGTMTSVQDHPARSGYWHVGIPPSGAFDNFAFDIGNRMLGNDPLHAGLEFTIQGAVLKFHQMCKVVLVGASMSASLDNKPVCFYQVLTIQAGQVLAVAKLTGAGARAYLCVQGGIDCPEYLDSRSTFTLGQFGGHCGRALRAGDMLQVADSQDMAINLAELAPEHQPRLSHHWQLQVIYGPHGAPDFFTTNDIRQLFDVEWEVHYNSSRTGIRLNGPKPEWARSDGGEAGLHPSNIHDNAYAFGAVDFTGDMPVILGPDGPSLGGFVCPITVIDADLWKLGQLKAGDTISFVPLEQSQAVEQAYYRQDFLSALNTRKNINDLAPAPSPSAQSVSELLAKPLVLATTKAEFDVVYRPQGDRFLLVEYGEQELDLKLRFRSQALLEALKQHVASHQLTGIEELTPGIRSLQIHYDSKLLSQQDLLSLLQRLENNLLDVNDMEFDSRIVYLPLSWDDPACQEAINKYSQSVRPNAPWAPSNIDFIRRINGLSSVDEVQKIVFDASYLVMGLGDVYLGAPVATPMDPSHRLVTTKYNPARTWTAENSVGIGGAYMCVYGMEGPGGYQFVGRTLQMWNRYQKTQEFEKPWLLRFFDQIRFYPVSNEHLQQIRRDFPNGRYSLKIEKTKLNMQAYQALLDKKAEQIETFTQTRQQAFQQELEHWKSTGQFTYEQEVDAADQSTDLVLADKEFLLESPAAGSVWQILVKEGDSFDASGVLMVLESMKMELEIPSLEAGTVSQLLVKPGQQINAGQALMVLTVKD
ncbi:urea carboxylase [Agaribacterium sp. ZY112]|uniref:urea carboxylase n=1 Tax=Agaribacterium sp. ZY112 TaxID=3233574 RepID=UPI0035257A3E